ncbi:MAG: hypothetical protein GY856_20160 [bacterium]|nr:hypothetical protein [bacterium]
MVELEKAAAWIPDFFLLLWHRLVPRTPDIYSEDWSGRQCHEAGMIRDLLWDADTWEVPPAILSYLRGLHPITWPEVRTPPKDPDRRAHVVAQCIDEFFGRLHPRWRPGEDEPAPTRALRRFRRHYRQYGRFNRSEGATNLVLKTPLRPGSALPRTEEGGNRLEDQFEWLTCFPSSVPGKPCTISLRVLEERKDIELGDAPEPDLRVALIPLAERAEDLVLEARRRGESCWLDVRPAAEREEGLAEKAAEALRLASKQGAQVAVLPELVVSAPVRRAIFETLEQLVNETQGLPRLQLVVAGSGLSEERHPESGMPYNECIVFGREGRELWRQRKLNHYSVPGAVLESCGVEVPETEAGYRERFHAGRVLQVRDSALGRMAVLICQDLYEFEPGERLLDQLRPDWVFCPVLDGEIRVGRWTHQRANPIADRHGVSTVVVNSLSRAVRENPDRLRLGFGLCVDAGHPFNYRITRCGIAKSSATTGPKPHPPRLAVVHWRPEDWSEMMRIVGRRKQKH